jgi:hypothetical protein
MPDLTIIHSGLPEFSVADVAALSPQQLQQFDLTLTDLLAWIKQARAKLDAALVARYGEAAQAALLASGRDFGVTHLTDGDLRVTCESPKKVTWNQPKLAAIASRIAANGEKVEDYLTVEFSVSESRWNGWPPVLKEQFAAARTTKAGKPTFRLALIAEE